MENEVAEKVGMKRRRLNERQRTVLAEKLADLANIATGSLIFGYVIRSDAFNQYSLIIGLLVTITAYIFAILLER